MRSRIAAARHVRASVNSYAHLRPAKNHKGLYPYRLLHEDLKMLSQIQRFGGAMFTPVLLFPFAGIVVGIAIMLRNPLFVGEALNCP
jgi:PTS system arbutin-like IIC component